MIPMHAMDAGWLLLDGPSSPLHVSLLLEFTKAKERRQVSIYDEWLTRYRRHEPSPPFNYVAQMPWSRGYWPHWVQASSFEFSEHIRPVALVSPHDQTADLEALAGWLHGLPLSRSRPLWEVYLIEGLSDHRYAILMKVHHSLIDGVGGMRHLYAALSADPRATAKAPLWAHECPTVTHRPRPTAAAPGARWSSRTWTRLQGLLRDGLSGEVPLPFSASRSCLNQDINPSRQLLSCDLDLATMQHLAKEHGGHLNDSLLLYVSEAMRAHVRHVKLKAAPLKAIMPFSTRCDGDLSSGSQLGFAVAELHNDISRVDQRIKRIIASTRSTKRILGALSHQEQAWLTAGLGGAFLAGQKVPFLRHHAPPFGNLVVSNVQGPDQTLYLNGDQLDRVVPLSVLLDGQALNATGLSYRGRLHLSFVSCPSVLGDTAHLGKAVRRFARGQLKRCGGVQPISL